MVVNAPAPEHQRLFRTMPIRRKFFLLTASVLAPLLALLVVLVDALHTQMRTGMLIASIAGTAFAAVFALWLMVAISGRLAGGITRLRDIALRVAAGTYDNVIDKAGDDELSTLYAKGLVDTLQAGSTPLEVQRVPIDDSALGAACEVVYLGGLSDAERERVNTAVAGHPVLTIAEHDPSCTAGSMFCLNVDGERVTFDINLDAVARSGVRVHPNVLSLARRPVTP